MRYPLIHHLAGKACFLLCLIEIYTENMLMICATSVSTGGLWNMLDSTWNPLISHQSLCVLQTSNNSWTSPCKIRGPLKFGVKHGLQSALYDIAIAMFDHWESFRFQGSTRRSPALGPFRRAKGDWEVRDPQGLSQASADGTSGPKPWGHDGQGSQSRHVCSCLCDKSVWSINLCRSCFLIHTSHELHRFSCWIDYIHSLLEL